MGIAHSWQLLQGESEPLRASNLESARRASCHFSKVDTPERDALAAPPAIQKHLLIEEDRTFTASESIVQPTNAQVHRVAALAPPNESVLQKDDDKDLGAKAESDSLVLGRQSLQHSGEGILAKEGRKAETSHRHGRDSRDFIHDLAALQRPLMQAKMRLQKLEEDRKEMNKEVRGQQIQISLLSNKLRLQLENPIKVNVAI